MRDRRIIGASLSATVLALSLMGAMDREPMPIRRRQAEPATPKPKKLRKFKGSPSAKKAARSRNRP